MAPRGPRQRTIATVEKPARRQSVTEDPVSLRRPRCRLRRRHRCGRARRCLRRCRCSTTIRPIWRASLADYAKLACDPEGSHAISPSPRLHQRAADMDFPPWKSSSVRLIVRLIGDPYAHVAIGNVLARSRRTEALRRARAAEEGHPTCRCSASRKQCSSSDGVARAVRMRGKGPESTVSFLSGGEIDGESGQHQSGQHSATTITRTNVRFPARSDQAISITWCRR